MLELIHTLRFNPTKSISGSSEGVEINRLHQSHLMTL